MTRNVAKAEVRISKGEISILKALSTSQLLTPARQRPHNAGNVGSDASDDVNAYGAPWRAVRALQQRAARRKLAAGPGDVR